MGKDPKITVVGQKAEANALSEEELSTVAGGRATAFQGKCISDSSCCWTSPYSWKLEDVFGYLKGHMNNAGHQKFEINEKEVTVEY